MSQDYSPSLVTKNLVFCGDAAMKSAAGPATLLYDKVNNNNGTMYNGTCFDFDGTDDKVVTNNAVVTGTGDFTFTAWINIASFASTNLICGNYGVGNTGGVEFYTIAAGNKLRVHIVSGGINCDTSLVADTWYHVGVTRLAGVAQLYVNGAADGASGTYAGSIVGNNDFSIGNGEDYTSENMDGIIADVKAFNVALSAANMKELYDDSKVIIPTKNAAAGGFVSQTNLIGWWPLAEGAGDICYDGSGNGYHGIVSNDDGDEWLTGQTGCPQLVEGYNRPMLFDGSSNYVQVASDGSTDFANQSYTVAGWLYVPDAGGFGGERVIFSYDYTSHVGPYYAIQIRLDSGGGLFFAWNDGSQYRSLGAAGAFGYDNRWYHLACTYTSGAQKIYIDGVQVAQSTRTDTITFYNQEVWIGRANWGGYWEGLINELAVYNSALTLAQVQALAATGPNGEPLPPNAAGIEDNASGGTVTTSDGWTIHTFTSSGTFTPSFSTDVEVLVVAGGGGGGTHSGGGGGAGGLLYYGLESPKTPNGSAVSAVSGVSYTITVGAGGAGGYAATTWAPPYHQNVGVNGVNSSMVGGAVSLTAIGGGGGSNAGGGIAGVAGGCGGGGGRIYAGGAGTAGQGYAGSNGFNYGGSVTPQYPGAGGGGAGGTGTAGSNTDGGDGGVGLQYSISGTATYYAGGGGGNIQGGSGSGGAGGNGGGGAGSAQNVGGGYGFNATTNTGGGGGGTQYYATPATGRYGNGGSGIVIIRYRTKSFLETGNIRGYWRNDGDVTWADRSGNGNTGTVNGSPDALLFKQGINGSASTSTGRDGQGFPLKFKNVGAVGFNGVAHASGSGEYISLGTCPTILEMAQTSETTILAWVKLDRQSVNNGIISAFSSTSYPGWSLCCYEATYNKAMAMLVSDGADGSAAWLRQYYDGGGGAVPAGKTPEMLVDRWYHVAVTISRISGTTSVYYSQDGVKNVTPVTNSSEGGSTGWGNGKELIIGRGAAGWGDFNGQIANVQIYKTILTDAEIQQNYNSFKNRFGK